MSRSTLTAGWILGLLLTLGSGGCSSVVDPFERSDGGGDGRDGADGTDTTDHGCQPATCDQLQATCGSIDNGCGQSIDCGPACGLERPGEPVIITGSQFDGLTGIPLSAVRLYRYEGAAFAQVRAQVDERVSRTFGLTLGGLSLGSPELSYVFSNWGFGKVSDDSLAGQVDDDDEVVLLTEDAAAVAPVSAWVAGADPTRFEIALTDPVDGKTGRLYLFTFPAGAAPDPLPSEVAYAHETNRTATVQTSAYRIHFASNWILDELMVAGQADLIDRFKGRAGALGLLGKTEEDWDPYSLYVGDLSGPVRTVREIVGAEAGVTTTLVFEFYPDRFRYTTYLRMKETTDIWSYVDYDSRRGAMTYRDDLLPDPLAIDGVPDAVSTPLRTFAEVTSAAGTLVHLYELLNTRALLNGPETDLAYFYADDSQGAANGFGDTTGDDQPTAWGDHGIRILRLCVPLAGEVPACPENDPQSQPCCLWKPPATDALNTGTYLHPLVYRQTVIPLPPGTAAVGALYRSRLDQPLTVTVRSQRLPTSR